MYTRTVSKSQFGVLASTLILTATSASGADVGYYDVATGQGEAYQVAPITATGETAVQMTTLSAAELDTVDVLYALNPDNSAYGQEWIDALGDITTAVNSGLVLCFAGDRNVTDAASRIPGAGGITFVRTFVNDANIDVLDNTTLVTMGSNGTINDTNLDGGTSSNHGHATTGTLPSDGTTILTDGDSTHAVTFSYPIGSGAVVYSTVPTDFYLRGFGPNPPRDNFNNIYAPNTIEYCANLVNKIIEVPVENCAAGGPGCPISVNPEGEPTIVVETPAGFVPPANAELTAFTFVFPDPRVDEYGVCEQVPLAFEVMDGIIASYPKHLCGKDGKIFVTLTQSNFDIQDGTMAIEMFPEAFVGEDAAAACEDPILNPMGTDLQMQGSVVWSGIGEVAQDVTDGCASSRGLSRGKSIFSNNMTINVGIKWMETPEAVEQAVIGLTVERLEDLVDAVKFARPAFKKRYQFFVLKLMSRIAHKLSQRGNHKASLKVQKIALRFLNRSKIDTTLEFNHFGNIRAILGNTMFMTRVRVIPFLP